MTTTATREGAGTRTPAETESEPPTETRTAKQTSAPTDGLGRRHAVVPTELGELTLVVEDAALVGVYFPGHQPAPDPARFGAEVAVSADPVLTDAAQQLVDYAAGRREAFDLPLRAVGSERARQVWDLIAAVPRGGTTTYAALGRAVGVGPRAAGQFVARNPLSVVVACHRVVASDGRLTGYAGGVDRKRHLLELEGVLVGGAVVVPALKKGVPATRPGDLTASDAETVDAGEVDAKGEGAEGADAEGAGAARVVAAGAEPAEVEAAGVGPGTAEAGASTARPGVAG